MVSAGDVVEDRIEGELAHHAAAHVGADPPGGIQSRELRARARGARRVSGGCGAPTARWRRRCSRSPQPPPDPAALGRRAAARRQLDGRRSANFDRRRRINPLERLQTLASEVASALDFMAAKFGPPALPHLTVSPIPGTFGQGFPGLVYLSTLSYLKHLPRAMAQTIGTAGAVLRRRAAGARDGAPVVGQPRHGRELSRLLADGGARQLLGAALSGEEQGRAFGGHDAGELPRRRCWRRTRRGRPWNRPGPIVLGPRLETSLEPRAWRTITYGKGSWIIHMLRRRHGR